VVLDDLGVSEKKRRRIEEKNIRTKTIIKELQKNMNSTNQLKDEKTITGNFNNENNI